MSMYGESPYNGEKNDMFEYIRQFLETRPISELIHIIADVIEDEVESEDCISEFRDYQIEWLTNHCDIELEPELEDLIVRFLNDTAEVFITKGRQMSKYYKAEDVINTIERLKAEISDDSKPQPMPITICNWLFADINDRPTIEVSEDTAIRIIENECFRDDLSKEIKDYLFSDLRHKLYHEQAEVSEGDELKFYYVESIDDYWIGKRLDNFYYAEWRGNYFIWTHSRYLPWGEHIVNENTLWKEHTYPSEPKEIPFTEWIVGFMKKYGSKVSEDCISREWVRENMLKYGFLAPDMTVAEFVADAPSVVPTTDNLSAVEDCISRAYAIEVLSHVKEDEQWRAECIDNEIRLIKLLPSVVPKERADK